MIVRDVLENPYQMLDLPNDGADTIRWLVGRVKYLADQVDKHDQVADALATKNAELLEIVNAAVARELSLRTYFLASHIVPMIEATKATARDVMRQDDAALRVLLDKYIKDNPQESVS